VPQPGGVAKHHFHWEKMGHIYGISSFQKWLYDSWYVLNG
jgi:hypothetical protein